MAYENDARWVKLMAAAQNGDRRSYSQLLREIVPVLIRAVQRRWPMGQAADIDDVVQETLKSLHSYRHTYNPGRPFLPWLLAIARHRLADEIRRQKRTGLREVAIEVEDETFLGVATNTEYSSAADGEALKRAIAQLAPKQRTALELLKIKEMSLKEAAAASGMSVAALKVATHRALKTLRAMLGKQD